MTTIPSTAAFATSLLAILSLAACTGEDSSDPSSVKGLSISITNPAGVSTIQTPDIVVSISGIVESTAGVDSVTWRNDRGGEGIANGKETWTTGNIVLQLGTNVVTIEAQDIAGHSVSRQLTVERENTTATGTPASTNHPVVMFSYESNLSNAAPVRGASIIPQPVYIFVSPGTEWIDADIDYIKILCCKGQSGPGRGDGYFRSQRVNSPPWVKRYDLSGFEVGGIRRVKVWAVFTDGTQSDDPVFDFSVSTTRRSGNSPPSISGSPVNSATVGNQYSFRPSASDADGDTILFSVSNKPTWASFSSSTGRLHGTPGANDVATYDSIVISASDGSTSSSLPPFSIAVSSFANGTARLSWVIPTQRVDNSPLDDLFGFNIYYGQSSGDYGNKATLSDPSIDTYLVDNLSAGTWYFVITAVDSNGLESNPSNEKSKSF